MARALLPARSPLTPNPSPGGRGARGEGRDGSDLGGKRILLYAEQGLGDTIMFVRYAARVKQRGGTVIVECQEPLASLLASCPGVDRAAPSPLPLSPRERGRGEGASLPDAAVQASLLSLPYIFRTSLATIPAEIPYLAADPQRAARWREELAGDAVFKIGIAWKGSPEHPKDSYRSILLANFAPIARLKGVRLFSLQKGPGAEQIQDIQDHFAVTDLGSRLEDFMDTAALMAGLDLIITADTAACVLRRCSWCSCMGCSTALCRFAGCLIVKTRPGIPRCDYSAKARRGSGRTCLNASWRNYQKKG